MGIVQVEENTIQGTLKCGVEVISLTSHRPETACSSFPAPYTNRRHGLYYIIDYLQKQTTLDKLKSPPVQILDSYAEIHNFDMEIFK